MILPDLNLLLYAYNPNTDLGAEFPQWSGTGYQIVGFGWHQGWNDRVTQEYNDEYEANMKDFIDDVRTELGQAALPFVIATTGMSGWDETHPRALSLMNAQLAMADFEKYPGHEGNVDVIDTRDPDQEVRGCADCGSQSGHGFRSWSDASATFARRDQRAHDQAQQQASP